MIELKEWFELAKALGPGASFILGVVVWAQWRKAISDDKKAAEEEKYQRERDDKMREVLVGLTGMLRDLAKDGNTEKERMFENLNKIEGAIDTLQRCITEHLLRQKASR